MPAASSSATHPIIGCSAAIESLRRLIDSLAASSSTALITGESGTGKELVAQSLHQRGPRRDGPFVPINCGAIPRELIESELFGHRKGAFTGAFGDRLGRFELAHGGTLFLDEIGDLPSEMQVKLLRVLQERSILPVGASREVPIDVRVIAATHKDLYAEVQAGRFREDLFYRLNVLPITTTPLRARTDDLALLLDHYASRHAMSQQAPIAFDALTLTMLTRYPWPGNVRELSNLVDRFSTLFPGEQVQLHRIPTCMLPPGMADIQSGLLQEHHGCHEVPLSALHEPAPSEAVAVALPEGACWPAKNDLHAQPAQEDELSCLLSGLPESPVLLSATAAPRAQAGQASNDEINSVEQAIFLAQGIQILPPEGISLKQHLVDIERNMIEQALSRTSGNVSKTARLLQLQRTTLIEKINKYDLRSSG